VNVSQRRELTKEMGRTTGGYELVFSPLLLALVGFGIDKLLGTLPLFTILFAVLGLIGAVTKIVYTYNSEMEQHEKSGPWVK
jgi:F0F1-type ATP synthase assembly protein I